jgi:hypothetical protein
MNDDPAPQGDDKPNAPVIDPKVARKAEKKKQKLLARQAEQRARAFRGRQKRR